MERPTFFLPSEVARLVLGYLKESRHNQTYKSFLKECEYLSEYAAMLSQGIEYPTTIMGMSLLKILDEYAELKLKDKDQRLFPIDMGAVWKQFDAVTCQLKRFSRTQGMVSSCNQQRERTTRSRRCNQTSVNSDPAETVSEVTPSQSVIKVVPCSVKLTPMSSRGLVGDYRTGTADNSDNDDVVDETPTTAVKKAVKVTKRRRGQKKMICNAYDRRKKASKRQTSKSLIDDNSEVDGEEITGTTFQNDQIQESAIAASERTPDKGGDRSHHMIHISENSSSRSDAIFDNCHRSDVECNDTAHGQEHEGSERLDGDGGKKQGINEWLREMDPQRTPGSSTSNTDSHALIVHESPVTTDMQVPRTPVKALMADSKTCDNSSKSPRRKKHQPKRRNDVEVSVPLPPPPEPRDDREESHVQSDPFPMLLEKIMNDTKLHERLAATINKSRFVDHSHTPCQKPVETTTIVDDFFSPCEHDMLSEDTIDGIIGMTKHDPVFDSLLTMFEAEAAKTVQTSAPNQSASESKNTVADCVAEDCMTELSQDGFMKASMAESDNPTLCKPHTPGPAPSPCPSGVSVTSSVGSPGQVLSQKKRRIKPIPCNPVTSALPVFSSPVMHPMSPAQTPEPCSPAQHFSPCVSSPAGSQVDIMSPPHPHVHTPQASPAPVSQAQNLSNIQTSLMSPPHSAAIPVVTDMTHVSSEHNALDLSDTQPSIMSPPQSHASPVPLSEVQYHPSESSTETGIMSPPPPPPPPVSVSQIQIPAKSPAVDHKSSASLDVQSNIMPPPLSVSVPKTHMSVPVHTTHQPPSPCLITVASIISRSSSSVQQDRNKSCTGSLTQPTSVLTSTQASTALSILSSIKEGRVGTESTQTSENSNCSQVDAPSQSVSTSTLVQTSTVNTMKTPYDHQMTSVSSSSNTLFSTLPSEPPIPHPNLSQQTVSSLPLLPVTGMLNRNNSNSQIIIVPTGYVSTSSFPVTSQPILVSSPTDSEVGGVNINIQENGVIETPGNSPSQSRLILPLSSIPTVSVIPSTSESETSDSRKKSSSKAATRRQSKKKSNSKASTKDLSRRDSLQTVTALPGSIVSVPPHVTSTPEPITDPQSILGPLASGRLPPGMSDAVVTSHTQMSFDLLEDSNLSHCALSSEVGSPKAQTIYNLKDAMFPAVVINDQFYEMTLSPNGKNFLVGNAKPVGDSPVPKKPTVTVVPPSLLQTKPSETPVKKRSKKKVIVTSPKLPATSPRLSKLQDIVRQQVSPKPKDSQSHIVNILSKSPRNSKKTDLPSDGYFISPNRPNITDAASPCKYVAIPLGRLCEDESQGHKKSLTFDTNVSPQENMDESGTVLNESSQNSAPKAVRIRKIVKSKIKMVGRRPPRNNSGSSVVTVSVSSPTGKQPNIMSLVNADRNKSKSRSNKETDQNKKNEQEEKSKNKTPVKYADTNLSDTRNGLDCCVLVTPLQKTQHRYSSNSFLSSTPLNKTLLGGKLKQLSPGNFMKFVPLEKNSPTSVQISTLTEQPVFSKEGTRTAMIGSPKYVNSPGHLASMNGEDSNLSCTSSIHTAVSDPGPRTLLENGAAWDLKMKSVKRTMTPIPESIRTESASTELSLKRKRSSSHVSLDQGCSSQVSKRRKMPSLSKLNVDSFLSKIHK